MTTIETMSNASPFLVNASFCRGAWQQSARQKKKKERETNKCTFDFRNREKSNERDNYLLENNNKLSQKRKKLI